MVQAGGRDMKPGLIPIRGTWVLVYGAGGLWNWKLTPDEPGFDDWCNSNVSCVKPLNCPVQAMPDTLEKH